MHKIITMVLNLFKQPPQWQLTSRGIVIGNKIYFSNEELMSPDTMQYKFAIGFLDKLMELRIAYNNPMSANSMCRSKQYNKQVGGSENSYHIYDNQRGCMAIDVQITNNRQRHILSTIAQKLGWSVGHYKTHLHLDRRTDIGKPNIVFLGTGC